MWPQQQPQAGQRGYGSNDQSQQLMQQQLQRMMQQQGQVPQQQQQYAPQYGQQQQPSQPTQQLMRAPQMVSVFVRERETVIAVFSSRSHWLSFVFRRRQ
jgi:hypothetical protein